MKRVLFFVALMLAGVASCVGQSGITGTWRSEGVAYAPWTFTLKAEGAGVTGTVSQQGGSGQETTPIYGGAIEGNRVSFRCDNPGGGRTVTFSGVLTNDAISFTREVQIRPGGSPGYSGVYGAYGPSHFTARRVAAPAGSAETRPSIGGEGLSGTVKFDGRKVSAAATETVSGRGKADGATVFNDLARGPASAAARAPFPLEKGNYWIYRATLRWADKSETGTKKDVFLWKMQVMEAARAGDVVIARMQGHPEDLTVGSRDSMPARYLMVVVQDDRVYRLEDPDSPRALRKLMTNPLTVTGLLAKATLDLAGLRENGGFGRPSWLSGEWKARVRDRERAGLKGIKGVAEGRKYDKLTVLYTADVGKVLQEFASGIGITRYSCKFITGFFEDDLRLVEFGRGRIDEEPPTPNGYWYVPSQPNGSGRGSDQ